MKLVIRQGEWNVYVSHFATKYHALQAALVEMQFRLRAAIGTCLTRSYTGVVPSPPSNVLKEWQAAVLSAYHLFRRCPGQEAIPKPPFYARLSALSQWRNIPGLEAALKWFNERLPRARVRSRARYTEDASAERD